MSTNIPNLTEHRAITLFNKKYGTDVFSRFRKVKEEFSEFSEAFYDYTITGNDEHLIDEVSDLQATLTHFASLFNIYQKQLLSMARDKVVKRETDPDYKRYASPKHIGLIGAGDVDIDGLMALKEALLDHKCIIVGGPDMDMEFSRAIDRLRQDQVTMEIKAPPIMPERLIQAYEDFKEPKPGTKNFRNQLPKFNNSRNKRKR